MECSIMEVTVTSVHITQFQRLDTASNSGVATFGKTVNIKVIFKIPGEPIAIVSTRS